MNLYILCFLVIKSLIVSTSAVEWDLLTPYRCLPVNFFPGELRQSVGLTD